MTVGFCVATGDGIGLSFGPLDLGGTSVFDPDCTVGGGDGGVGEDFSTCATAGLAGSLLLRTFEYTR